MHPTVNIVVRADISAHLLLVTPAKQQHPVLAGVQTQWVPFWTLWWDQSHRHGPTLPRSELLGLGTTPRSPSHHHHSPLNRLISFSRAVFSEQSIPMNNTNMLQYFSVNLIKQLKGEVKHGHAVY